MSGRETQRGPFRAATLKTEERKDVGDNFAFPGIVVRQCWGKRVGQARKGVRWMPWRKKPMKDAVSCDNLRGGATA